MNGRAMHYPTGIWNCRTGIWNYPTGNWSCRIGTKICWPMCNKVSKSENFCIFAPFLRAKNSSRKAYIGTILFPVCYSIKIFMAAKAE